MKASVDVNCESGIAGIYYCSEVEDGHLQYPVIGQQYCLEFSKGYKNALHYYNNHIHNEHTKDVTTGCQKVDEGINQSQEMPGKGKSSQLIVKNGLQTKVQFHFVNHPKLRGILLRMQ
jgi:hypothetical protein